MEPDLPSNSTMRAFLSNNLISTQFVLEQKITKKQGVEKLKVVKFLRMNLHTSIRTQASL